MNLTSTRGQLPTGVRDLLPWEAAQMRRLSGRLAELFRSWGYREVVTPGFEYLETVTAGAGQLGRREDLYQFFDRKGRTLALRADMTTPIARVAATRLGSEPLPLRLSYQGPVFRRRDEKAGTAAEIWQGGIELIGASGVAADAEAVALACEALAATGLQGFKVGLGHVDFVAGIFEAAGVGPELEAELKAALVARDLVAFEKAVREAGLTREEGDLLVAMATFQGDYPAAVRRFGTVPNVRVARALEQLGTILRLLAEFGVASQVALDLGLARSLDYYTGVVFEGYAPGVGAPILGGGRYDGLLADFGGDLPAIGFALEMGRLLAALERQGRMPADVDREDLIVACPPGQEVWAMAAARNARASGLAVAVDLLGRTGAELEAYARARGARRILYPDGTEQFLSTDESEAGNGTGSVRRQPPNAVTSIH